MAKPIRTHRPRRPLDDPQLVPIDVATQFIAYPEPQPQRSALARHRPPVGRLAHKISGSITPTASGAVHSQSALNAIEAAVEVAEPVEHFTVVLVHFSAEGSLHIVQSGVVDQDADEDDNHRRDRGQRHSEELGLRHVVSVADWASSGALPVAALCAAADLNGREKLNSGLPVLRS